MELSGQIEYTYFNQAWVLKGKYKYYEKRARSTWLSQQRICLHAIQEMRIRSLGQEDPLEKDIAPHSSIPAWRSPRTEEPGSYSPQAHKEADVTEATEHARSRTRRAVLIQGTVHGHETTWQLSGTSSHNCARLDQRGTYDEMREQLNGEEAKKMAKDQLINTNCLRGWGTRI